MKSSEMTEKLLELEVPENATIGKIEKLIDSFFRDEDYSSVFLIDLSNVIYIQTPTTLIYLAQLIYRRDLEGYHTLLRLPKNKKIISILYTWRLFEVIEELTGKKISNFIVGELDRFSNAKFVIGDKEFYLDITRDYFDKYYREDQVKKLVKKGFFSLICEPFNENKQRALVLKKHRRTWYTEKLITDVLQQNLLEDVHIGNLLSNTIIFESLTNAINHPKSDHVVIGSFYDFSNNGNSEDKTDYFTIAIWDDGESIIKTLSDSINSGISIRSEENFELAKKTGYKSWFRIIKEDSTVETEKEYLYYDFLPEKKSNDCEILVSSFFPGTSRLPKGLPKKSNINKSVNNVQKYLTDDIDTSSGTGLGLTFLLKAITHDLNGSIHVRTQNYLLEITRARKGGSIEYNDMFFYKKIDEIYKKDVDFFCKAKLRYYSTRSNSFKGNMLTIKIPLKKYK